jgi:hypothetical protein
MSAEPARRPEDETATPESPAGTGDPASEDSLTGAAAQPVTAPGETLNPEVAADAEAAASSEAASPSEAGQATGDAAMAASDADPAAAEAAVAAADAQAAPTTAQAIATVDAANEAGSAETRSRRRSAAEGLRRLGVVLVGLALLVAGVALGSYIFQTSRPPATGSSFSPGAEHSPPPVAREFIAALAANDLDAVRSSLDPDPHLDLTDELDRFGIQRIAKIETLGTSIDDTRSATEILMQYESDTGAASAINLVILTDGGKIEGFR